MKKIISCLLILFSSVALANTISLYQSPQDNAKVISQVNGGTQLIPVFYPKQGAWLKVANPQNGDVGWVKFADLKGESPLPGMQGMRFKQRLESRESNGKAPEVVRIIEYSGPQRLSEDEIRQLITQMQRRQAQMNASMQLMMRAMVQDFNHFSRQDSFAFEDDFFTFPFIQPMLIVPKQGEHKAAPPKSKVSWWQTIKNKVPI